MKKYLLIGALVLTLGLLGGGAYYLSQHNDNTTVVSAIEDNVNWNVADSYDLDLSGTTTINKGGVYTITGTIENGQLIINTNDDVKLILNNVSITNKNGPAIYIMDANCTYIELVGENVLNGTVNAELDTVLLSKDDLYIEGEGTLKVISNLDGISSSDNLTINSGNFIIEAGDDGVKGKDSLIIENGNFTITAGGDAIKTTNEEELGNLVIKNGTFNITTNGDGITSISTLEIENGEFTIKTGKNVENSSQKGIKADGILTINGGTFKLNINDDGFHSNKNVIINNGTFTITSNDDAIHADGLVEINDGTFTINAHEGIEGTYIKINGGDININASDDGINAGNKSSDYQTTIEINDGNITIVMGQGDTDGIDSNGNIYINGGTINITGNSPFDYDGEAKYNGGTIIVNGETTNTITNQFMGGGMINGGMPNDKQQNGNPNGGQTPTRGNRQR